MKKIALLIFLSLIAQSSLAKPIKKAKPQYEFRPSNDYEVIVILLQKGLKYVRIVFFERLMSYGLFRRFN